MTTKKTWNETKYNEIIIASGVAQDNESEFNAEAQEDEVIGWLPGGEPKYEGRVLYASDDYPTEAEAIQDVKDWLDTPKSYEFQKSIKWVNFNLEIEAKTPAEAVKIMKRAKFTDWSCVADNDDISSLKDLFNLRAANQFLKGTDEDGNIIL